MALMAPTVAAPAARLRSILGAMCDGSPALAHDRRSSHCRRAGYDRHIRPTVIARATVGTLAAREETIYDGV